MAKNHIFMRLMPIFLVIMTSLFSFGFAFAQNDSDGDGFNDNVDECPNTRGMVRGCPDSDGDGFHDREDECPNQFGTVRGCPDSDGDGRPDATDECPDMAGTVRGCPDLDGDGFHILEDECPGEFGTVRGCPDTDGDGRADIVDECPNTPGNVRGCPDSDGDGFHDREDECPNVVGTIRGCPDTDGDGRPDVTDDCPTVPGEIRGCPPTNTPQPTTAPSQNTNQNNVQMTPTPTPTPSAVTSAPAKCELIPNSDDAVLIYEAASVESSVVGVFDESLAYTLYGVQTPEIWYWLDLGWVQGSLVSVTGDCGHVTAFDVPMVKPDEQIIINIAQLDIPRAQIACAYVIELADTVCFYQMPNPNENTQTMICLLQANVLNCEIGEGVLSALLADNFGDEPVPDDASDEPVQCADLMRDFLRPTDGTIAPIFSMVGDYVVGFVNPANFESVGLLPCVNQVESVYPMIANGEIQTGFAVQPMMTQYTGWQPFGGDDVSVYGDSVPIVALLSPDAQKLLAKTDELATMPIRIDFLNRVIVFGDGRVMVAYNTVGFDDLVKILTGIDFSPLE